MNSQSHTRRDHSTMPALQGWTLTFLLLAFAIHLTACQSAPQRPVGNGTSEDQGLVAWTDEELAPYLAQRLAQHPRFKGQAVLLVAVSGANVLPDIDQLTHSLRSRLTDALLESPGSTLVWRPSVRPRRHHRRPEQADCRDLSEVHYYVGIEISPVPGGEVRVRVRALDLQDETWVTGFGKHWQGRLSLAQSQAFQERHPDEYLRGLRVLPFSASQSDLVAAYLARNLSCLLRGHPDQERLVHVAAPEPGNLPLGTMLELVGNYLARYGAAQITEDSTRASLVLSGKNHQIRPDLQQVWVALRSRAGDESVDTAAYLQAMPARSAHRASSKSVGASGPTQQALVSALRMVRSPASSMCGSLAGERTTIARHEKFPVTEPDRCSALQFEMSDGAQVFLLSHRPDTGLRRLYPAACRETSAFLRRGNSRITFTFPTSTKGVSNRQVTTGPETYYVIGVSGTRSGERLQAHVNALSSDCGTDLGPTGDGLQDWLAQLDRLLREDPEQSDWQALRVAYEP